jgi:CheY-like chemotaxis protein
MGQQYLPRRILVVDDNHDAADTVAALLEVHGHATQAVYGGREALAATIDFSPDVIFLDIGMPGMDGYETAVAMRKLIGGENLLIVALTAWNDARARARVIEAGFDAHLTKPAQLDALLNATQRGTYPAAREARRPQADGQDEPHVS